MRLHRSTILPGVPSTAEEEVSGTADGNNRCRDGPGHELIVTTRHTVVVMLTCPRLACTK